jgi:predicted Zn-dependent peptidase
LTVPSFEEAMKQAGISIEREALPNGLVLVAEHMPHMRSVAIGIWVRAGSRGEPRGLNGIAHFIEHMVFKGTSRRTAEQIAREMDSVGGLLDAFTSKELVSFNAKVLDENLPVAFDVLSDLVLAPLFAEEDIAKEKQVILEEIRMEDDNPESLAHEMLTQSFWRGHPLGAPILGTRATVRGFARRSIVNCFEQWYTPENTVITAAGNVHIRDLFELVEKPFAGRKRRAQGSRNSRTAPHTHARLITRNKPALEQAHITLAVPSYPLAHPRRYAASVLNNILGGSMSSRLFQNIREHQGLAYAVFSELNPYSDAGMLSVYAGTSRSTAGRVLRSIAGEFARLKKEAVAADELRRAKDQLKGSLVLSLESPGARMSNLARQEIYFGRFFSVEELHASIEAVTAEDVQQTAIEFFEPRKIAATVVGPLDGFKLERDLLAC